MSHFPYCRPVSECCCNVLHKKLFSLFFHPDFRFVLLWISTFQSRMTGTNCNHTLDLIRASTAAARDKHTRCYCRSQTKPRNFNWVVNWFSCQALVPWWMAHFLRVLNTHTRAHTQRQSRSPAVQPIMLLLIDCQMWDFSTWYSQKGFQCLMLESWHTV